jgi:hypothetical protein
MSDDEAWEPLRERAAWGDVTPLPLQDGPRPVCAAPLTARWKARALALAHAHALAHPLRTLPLRACTLALHPQPCLQRCAPSHAHARARMHAQETHAYFAAVQAAGEVSGRARGLTTELIALNAANYTAWAWRWRCVAAAAAAEEDARRRGVSAAPPAARGGGGARRWARRAHGARGALPLAGRRRGGGHADAEHAAAAPAA